MNMSVTMKRNFSDKEKNIVKVLFVFTILISAILYWYAISMNWFFVNVYISLILFYYSIIKGSTVNWVLISVLISSVLWYYSMKYFPWQGSMESTTTYIKWVLSTFGFAFVSSVAYWRYNLKRFDASTIGIWTVTLGCICFFMSALIAFPFWAFLVGGIGRH